MFSYIDLEDLTGDYIDTNGGFDLEVDQHAYTNIYDLNARMKYYTPIAFWRFENYVIGALGYRAIVASYSDSYTTDTEYTDVEIEKWSSSMTYLIGTGFVFHLKNKTFLHFEGSMKNGGISRYLSIEDLGNELPKDNFKIKSSQSDIFALSLGLSFVF